MAAAPILLLLGSGPRIGASVVSAFIAKGFKIAHAGRSLDEAASTPNQLNIKADFADTKSISGIFAKVKEHLGLPSVVIYNASSRTLNDPKRPLDMNTKELRNNFEVNFFSVIETAREAVAAFEELPASASKTFIYTGNWLNEVIMPPVVGYGLTKVATARLIHASSIAYKNQGIRFYYADERDEKGNAMFQALSGEAAGEFYLELAEGKKDVPWQATHVKGTGYVYFEPRGELKTEFS